METDGKGSSFGPFISALSKNSLKGRYIGLLDISQKKKKKWRRRRPPYNYLHTLLWNPLSIPINHLKQDLDNKLTIWDEKWKMTSSRKKTRPLCHSK